MNSTQTNSVVANFAFEGRSRLVYIGSNPENADVDNPRGERYDVVYFVEAHTPKGNVYAHRHNFETQIGADSFAEWLTKATVTRINMDHWGYSRVAYGSKRYEEEEAWMVAQEIEEDMAR
jgi:hypothetical protein